jgi:SPP1 gp7 family putative phage head morphogenesis protein
MCFACAISPSRLPQNAVDDAESLIRQIALSIHQGKLTADTIPQELLAQIATTLWDGVATGYSLSASPTESQYALLRKMAHNVFVFSGAKTVVELKEMTAILYDTKGNPRPFSAFLKDVLQIHKTYNQAYLEAEYNHAVASSQMADNWQQGWENRDVAPFLKYQTAEDDHVRPEHAAVNGIVKAKEDPWWDTWYPPNGWNCRCDAIEVTAPESDDPTQPAIPVELPPMWRNNVGKTGIIFPETHPYFTESAAQSSAIAHAATTALEDAEILTKLKP